jgi:hypothetical protein
MKTKGSLTPTNMSGSDAAVANSPQSSPRISIAERPSKMLDRLGVNVSNGALGATTPEESYADPLCKRNISASNLMALSQGQLQLKVW